MWHHFLPNLGDLLVPTQGSHPPSLRDQSLSLGPNLIMKVRPILGMFWNPSFLDMDPSVIQPL